MAQLHGLLGRAVERTEAAVVVVGVGGLAVGWEDWAGDRADMSSGIAAAVRFEGRDGTHVGSAGVVAAAADREMAVRAVKEVESAGLGLR